MKKAFLISTALLLVSCQTTSSTFEVQAAKSGNWVFDNGESAGGELYSKGREYLASSDYGLAIDAFRKDIQINGPSVLALNGLGVTYDMLGRYDLSQKYYQQALDLNPSTPLTYSNLAYSQYKQGEYDNAVQLADAAKELINTGSLGEEAPEVMMVAVGNKALAEEEKSAEQEQSAAHAELAGNFVIERVGDRKWAMVKPEQKPVKKAAVKYKSSIAIAKILDRQAELVAEEGILEQDDLLVQEDFAPLPKRKPVIEQAEKVGEDDQEAVELAMVEIKEDVAAEPREQPAEEEAEKEPYKPPLFKVFNGTGRQGMARRMADFMMDNGYEKPYLGNADNFDYERSIIKYAPGYEQEALEFAKSLVVPAEIVESEDLKTDIELILGADFLSFDTALDRNNLKSLFTRII